MFIIIHNHSTNNTALDSSCVESKSLRSRASVPQTLVRAFVLIMEILFVLITILLIIININIILYILLLAKSAATKKQQTTPHTHSTHTHTHTYTRTHCHIQRKKHSNTHTHTHTHTQQTHLFIQRIKTTVHPNERLGNSLCGTNHWL